MAVAAAGAAGVFAFGGSAAVHTVDRTFLCTANDVGGVDEFVVGGSGSRYGSAGVSTSPLEILAPEKLNQEVGYHAKSFSDFLDGKIHYEKRNCAPAARSIPLTAHGVPLKDRLTGGDDSLECWVAKAYFRLRVTYDTKDAPVRTLLAMRNARTNKPLAYIDAAPPHLTIYAGDACLHGS